MSRHQRGHIFEAHGAFHVRYYVNEIVDGRTERKQRSHRLCTKDRKTGHGTTAAKAVRELCEQFMRSINQHHQDSHSLEQDMMVVTFWETVYLPYCEAVLPVTGLPRLKASTLRGYKGMWEAHLKKHFGNVTLQRYEPSRAELLLDSLTGTMNSTSLKHVRAIGSAIFKRALKEHRIKINPWTGLSLPDDAVAPENTVHYTPEQSENMVTALVDHVDAQLVLALACFLGLGPAEIAGLQWGDVDGVSIHIRRNRMQAEVSTTKNKWRAASVPIIDQVRVPLELWRKKSDDTSDGAWLIPDLHNLVGRVIKPHIKGDGDCVRCEKTPKKLAGVKWSGLYAGRRGAATMVIEASNGNIGLAQRLLRHKTADTTLKVYNKGISDKGFSEGMTAVSKLLTK